MATILGTLNELMTPDVVAQLAKAISVNAPVVSKSVMIAGPTVLGSLAQTAATTEGAAVLMQMIPRDVSASTTALRSELLEQLGKDGLSADMMNTVLGPGVNAIASTLSRTAGFDVRPVLALTTPLVMSLMGKAVKTDKLDAAGLAEMLQRESATFMRDPANTQTAGVAQGALKAGEQASTLRKTFDDLEWMKVRMAPLAALYLVVQASPSSAGGEAQEVKAAADTINDAVKNATPTSLLTTMFGNELTRNELDILKRDAPPSEKMLLTIKDAVEVVTAKDQLEAGAYGDMVLAVATQVANASAEGGFLGVGSKKVTDDEQRVLDAIASAIGTR
jgi:hypothetical protein